MGKLNILHHKSYHVYNRENVERVKRDELRAELEAEAKDQSTIAANSEARLTLLRNQKNNLKKNNSKLKEREIEKLLKDQLEGKHVKIKVDETLNEDSELNQLQTNQFQNNKLTDNSSIIDPKNGHINFWSNLENQSTSKVFGSKEGLKKNEAYMNDLKKKDEKWDELITMRLDKPAHELNPWYAQNDLMNGEDKKIPERKMKEKISKDESIKTANDPLTFIKSTLYPSESNKFSNLRKRKERVASRSPSPVVQPSGACPEPNEDDLDDMPELPPDINIIHKKSKSSPKLNNSSVPLPRILKVDESAEKLKAQALLQRHHAPTPRSEVASPYGYSDLYNRKEMEAIRFQSRHNPSNKYSTSSAPIRHKQASSFHSSASMNPQRARDYDSLASNRQKKNTRYWN